MQSQDNDYLGTIAQNRGGSKDVRLAGHAVLIALTLAFQNFETPSTGSHVAAVDSHGQVLRVSTLETGTTSRGFPGTGRRYTR